MDERRPKIDEVISTVCGEAAGLSTGIKRRRTLQVERDLRAFIEAEADRYLTDDERTILAAEQEFDPTGAACRALEARCSVPATSSSANGASNRGPGRWPG
ncbi:hypothetical protein [Cryobacterium sp.]|uniref:hypothetical protein n=1 Tax=Cryobacterium sp. TaxID=1926290 RepID=UPI00260A924B|nr:hypothetical protein [Cryobacterium sp.]